MLFRSVKLEPDETKVIDEISRVYRSLRYTLQIPSRWAGVLRRNLFARAVQGSNSIEGYVVTNEDALAAVGGEEPLEAEQETWSAVIGYRNAMTYVLQLAKDPNFSFNDGYLRSFHYMMLQHDLTKHPGNWRPGPIYVRDEQRGTNVYEGPQAEMVPSLIRELVLYLRGKEDDDHLLVKAAMAHLNLTMIHPFSDGNGRMARCLQTLVLATKGVVDPMFCSIEEYLGKNTQDYYNVLGMVGQGSWNPNNDTRPWIRFNLTAHYRQALTVMRRTRVYAKLWEHLERQITEKGLPERYILALIDAAVGFHVRSAHYRHNADVSAVLASRDLKHMVTSGFLVAYGERRGRRYKASEDLSAVATKIREQEPHKIPDPFSKEAGLLE